MRWKRTTRTALTIALAWSMTGCGIPTQFAFGWSSEETARTNKTHAIRLESQPPGAEVERQYGDQRASIGTTPLTDQVSYEAEETIARRGWLPMVIVGAVELIVGLSLAASVDTEPNSFEEEETSDALLGAGALFIIAGLVDTIWGGVRSFTGRRVVKSTVLGPTQIDYTAQKDGLPTASFSAQIPKDKRGTLVLDPTFVAEAPPPTPPPPPSAIVPTRLSRFEASEQAKSWVLAVMDVEDVNAESRTKRIDPSLVRNLGDQLRVFVSQSGVRTIDRSSQERAFKEQLNTIKSDSYKTCYDDSCQIELGKALAASHILRSRITKFGKRCVLNGELVDLRAEVTVKAASAQGNCEAEGFLTMCEQIARDLVR